MRLVRGAEGLVIGVVGNPARAPIRRPTDRPRPDRDAGADERARRDAAGQAASLQGLPLLPATVPLPPTTAPRRSRQPRLPCTLPAASPAPRPTPLENPHDQDRRPSLRVALVDDRPRVRAGFAMVIDSQDDMEVVLQATDGAEAVRELSARSVDVVLMDVRMPRMDGIEATSTLLERHLPSSRPRRSSC